MDNWVNCKLMSRIYNKRTSCNSGNFAQIREGQNTYRYINRKYSILLDSHVVTYTDGIGSIHWIFLNGIYIG
jgi:hypothetical protein